MEFPLFRLWSESGFMGEEGKLRLVRERGGGKAERIKILKTKKLMNYCWQSVQSDCLRNAN
jgi:hypothetical protein